MLTLCNHGAPGARASAKGSLHSSPQRCHHRPERSKAYFLEAVFPVHPAVQREFAQEPKLLPSSLQQLLILLPHSSAVRVVGPLLLLVKVNLQAKQPRLSDQ